MNVAFVTLAVAMLAGLKSVIDWGADIDRKIDDLAASIKAHGGNDPSAEQMTADIAASNTAHAALQGEPANLAAGNA